MSSLQWKKLKVLGADFYGTVYLATVVDTQTPYQSFIAVKSSIPRLAFSLKKEEQIFKSLCKGESGGCEEIIGCFGTETTRNLFRRPTQRECKLSIEDRGVRLSKTKKEEADVVVWKSKPRGTSSYLSSEAFSSHIDTPIDIWALGCIVIEMLTGLFAWG
ncbi:hypothetical protein HN51_026135 [Arachis hypogaea]|uniref:Uncharacterized protein LOC107459280 n=1 Tax=Arachis duranensis TaxID=130453 RepID=A0A6P4BN56_ARADU|nr:uncharacterized protein LOC107459280 [Arachis duranensis]XP_025608084.1 uncharacterized protein LOC112701555 [Arachis hypogaea]